MNERVVNAITEYQPIAAALAGIEKFRGIVFDVSTQQGMRDAKAAQREVAAPRIALEKVRKQLKEDVLERGRLIDGEAKRIAAKIEEIEGPIKAQIEAEERREQEAREAAVRAEQERLAAEERARRQAEENRLAEERARLAEERRKLEAEERERRARMQAEEDARRKALQEEEDRARAARRAEEERLAAERAELDKARREKEESERKAREEQDRLQREARLKAQEKADGRQLLATFVSRYGKLPEFLEIAAEIKAFLGK